MRYPVDWEEQCIRLPHTWTRNQVRRLLTDAARQDGWELRRVRVYRNGSREIWLRRKVMRLQEPAPRLPMV